jgi:hypothetical protein
MKERKSDILWKVIIEEVFDDLLRFVMPEADREYELERGFEFLEKELAEMYPEPEKASDTRFADKLVKVFNRHGGEDWILLHIEIQGDTSRRAEISERMFRYFYRILDRYRKPVSAVAIFTGVEGKKMPSRYIYRYWKTSVVYEYHTLSILDFTDQELGESNNPFALVVLAAKTSLLEKKIPEMELLERKILIANKLFQKGFTSKKIRAIFIFLESYVLFDSSEMNRIFKEGIEYNVKKNVMGIDEYIKQTAVEETKISVIKNLLSLTEFSNEMIARIAGVEVCLVEEVRREVK